jgi:ADP-L-glycero-D-manno-heptose 6-epimerase
MIAWHINHVLGREDIIIVDDIQHEDQWQNLVKRRYQNYLDKSELACFLAGNPKIDAIIHMGAISATTERDFNKLVQNNIRYSQFLWNWCAENKVPFLYASSAATYGAGEHGYDDTCDINTLRPLNGYGYSKQYFDQWALQQVALKKPSPPQWQGFKFFNVYGPNEYHKSRMASVIFHAFRQIKEKGSINLFRSHNPNYKDGEQLRDFIYVKDLIDVCIFLMEHRKNSGIYNLGTGKARSFNDLANATFAALNLESQINYVDTPLDIRDKYQYFTQANMSKLKGIGYDKGFYTLEEGVKDYVQNYLSTNLYW